MTDAARPAMDKTEDPFSPDARLVRKTGSPLVPIGLILNEYWPEEGEARVLGFQRDPGRERITEYHPGAEVDET